MIPATKLRKMYKKLNGYSKYLQNHKINNPNDTDVANNDMVFGGVVTARLHIEKIAQKNGIKL